jgi:potassium channel subfamily K, other eukaryote
MLSPKDPPREHGPDPEQQDPEKGGTGDDHEQEDEDEVDLHDFGEFHDGVDGEGAQNEHRPRQGVPLTPTATFSSSIHFSRPSLPNWLCKIKDVLFYSHEDHHEDILPNYRRIPIFSGSLIPFSILLEIPGLTEPWYVRTYNNVTIESRKNPPLIVVCMSISIGLAVLANIALIYRFLDRHVKRNTIICIVALTIHGNSFFLRF